jgi:hypothetical protein
MPYWTIAAVALAGSSSLASRLGVGTSVARWLPCLGALVRVAFTGTRQWLAGLGIGTNILTLVEDWTVVFLGLSFRPRHSAPPSVLTRMVIVANDAIAFFPGRRLPDPPLVVRSRRIRSQPHQGRFPLWLRPIVENHFREMLRQARINPRLWTETEFACQRPLHLFDRRAECGRDLCRRETRSTRTDVLSCSHPITAFDALPGIRWS